MSIILKGKSWSGGRGGSIFDDLEVFNNSVNGGIAKIKKIDFSEINMFCGDILDSVQSTYNVLLSDGNSTTLKGNMHGDTGGTLKSQLTFASGERLTEIAGRRGDYAHVNVVTYLNFTTSEGKTVNCGRDNDPNDTDFSVPVGIFFSWSGAHMDGFGTNEIQETTEPIQATITETRTLSTTETGVSSASDNSVNAPNNSKTLALSLSTAILGICFLTTMGIVLWKKFRTPKAIPQLTIN